MAIMKIKRGGETMKKNQTETTKKKAPSEKDKLIKELQNTELKTDTIKIIKEILKLDKRNSKKQN